MNGLTLRPLSFEDADSFSEYANNERVAANLRDVFPHPYARSDAEAFIKTVLDAGEAAQCFRAIIIDGRAVGCISLTLGQDVYRKSAELGYWLGEPFWRKGIMSWAVQEICRYGFAHYDICRIFAEPFATNLGSQAVLMHAGFTLEGVFKQNCFKNGKMLDSCMYAKLKDQ